MLYSFSEQSGSLTCGDQVYIEAIVGLVALIVAFAGYRIYTVSLGLCGALTACSFVAAAGFAWYGGNGDITDLLSSNITSTSDMAEISEGEQPVKLGVIAFFCLVWSVMGALICVKTHEKVHKVLGFICGAVLGFALVALIVSLVSSQMHKLDQDNVDEYKGWQMYLVFAAGVPCACIAGYATRNLLVYVLMAVTAFLGSFVGVGLLAKALECAATVQVHQMITLGVAVLFTVVAFLVQVKLTPETQKKCETAPHCVV